MKEFFVFLKRTLLGVAYVLGSPLIALVFTVFFIIGSLNFLFQSVYSIFLWIKGYGLLSPLVEDLTAHTRYENYLRQNPPLHRENPPVNKEVKS